MALLAATLCISLLILKVCVLLGGCIWIYQNYMKRKLPPGPYGLPILGYLPFLNKDQVDQGLSQLGRKYGPVYSVRMGTELVVVLTSAKAIKEAFSKPELNGRPVFPFFNIMNISAPLFENGKVWQQHRTFLERTFKQIGVGKSNVNDIIIREILEFIKIIEHQHGTPFNARNQLLLNLSKVVTQLVFGTELSENNKDTTYKIVHHGSECFHKCSALLFFPWIESCSFVKQMLRHSGYLQSIQSIADDMESILRSEMIRQAKTSDAFPMKSFQKAFNMRMKFGTSEYDESFNEKSLVGSVLSLYGASVLTVLTTIEWCFYVMAILPDVQSKVQEELDDVIGGERLPKFSDLNQLPFTHSVLMEMQRHYTVLPLSTPRMALEDVGLWGYTIPQGTIVMPDLHAAHHDPECFVNPEKFIPDRFFDPVTASTKKHESYMPFSVGKRRCPGEILAHTETFLFFTCILQNFSLHIPEDETVNTIGEMYVTYRLKSHKLRFVRRV